MTQTLSFSGIMVAGETSELPNWNKRIGATKEWPTPTTRDATAGAGETPKREGGRNLRTAVKLFPTPMSRDWKSGSVSDSTLNKNSRPLSEYVKGQLNPEWVEWLMGFKEEWTK